MTTPRRKKRNKTEERKLKRLLIEKKSYRCSIKGCTWKYNLQMHHIDHNPANNTLSNVCLLCPNHHLLVHEPPETIIIEFGKYEIVDLILRLRG